jgi:tetratricopeptide (TPR) repeat protein
MKLQIVLGVLLMLAPILSVADELETADQLYKSEQWEKVVEAYKKLSVKDPSFSLAWMRLGMAYQKLGRLTEAIDALQRAAKTGAPPAQVQLRLAQTYARAGEQDKAFESLNKAVAAGITNVQSILMDSDLVVLRPDKRFEQIISDMQKNATPCRYSPEFRQFDFWLGEWNVEANGQLAGTSSIQLILDDCVIFENWTSRGLSQGYSGKSFNIYNPALKKWEQLWVDNAGGVIKFQGEFKDGELRYAGKTPQADGTTVHERLTFSKLSEDRVRQRWEQSRDGGKSWQVVFDGTYQRRK